MFHLNLDSMMEALGVLQKERAYVESSLMMDSVGPGRTRMLRARIDQINDACQELTDRLVAAVEEMP